MPGDNIQSLPELEDRVGIFRDRAHAGNVLAGMLEVYRDSDALVLAIPAGGVPVAAAIASQLGLELGVLPVNKLLLPWTTESGFGAVAFDGTEWIDEALVMHFQLDREIIQTAYHQAKTRVERRLVKFTGSRPFPVLADRDVILVDDGIAAGSTMRAGIAALRNAGAGRILVAVPTGPARSVNAIAGLVDSVYCANLRGGLRFAVADAYRHWSDVSEEEVSAILDQHRD